LKPSSEEEIVMLGLGVLRGRGGVVLGALIAIGTFGVAAGAHDFPRRAWPLGSYDLAATANNVAEHKIYRHNVGALDVDWVFDTARAGRTVKPIHATPVVDGDGNAYVGDFGGTFYAVNAAGYLKWSATTLPPTPELAGLFPGAATLIIGGAALATKRPYVVFADANGRVYARSQHTGREIWTNTSLDSNPLGGVVGNSLSIVGDTVLVGLSSLENYAFVLSQIGLPVACCTHRGGVVALDLATGAVRWRYDTVSAAEPLPPSQAPFTYGPSGADVWSQPSVDLETSTVYISTGQNLSPTAEGGSTPTSDAIIALDFETGAVKWVHQFTENDVWAVGVPNPSPVTGQVVDMDLGDSPKLYRLNNGRKVVGAGQKDGRYHVLDATTGELVRTAQVIEPRNDLGGFQTGGAVGEGSVFQHGLAATAGFSTCNTGTCPYEGFDGVVVALTPNASQVRWMLRIPHSPLLGGLALANGVVYVQSTVEEANPLVDSPRWGLYALHSGSGAVLKKLTFPGRAIGTPVVADGHVFTTSGNGALPAYGFVQEGALTRFSLK
jgi:polyvinyl alcohol dehydrogenase (cytochrome)